MSDTPLVEITLEFPASTSTKEAKDHAETLLSFINSEHIKAGGSGIKVFGMRSIDGEGYERELPLDKAKSNP